jgi:hypothetical protein
MGKASNICRKAEALIEKRKININGIIIIHYRLFRKREKGFCMDVDVKNIMTFSSAYSVVNRWPLSNTLE